jgi:hypothetical protein
VFARWLAALLLVATFAPLATPHVGDDDALCAPVNAASDALDVLPMAAGQQAHHCVVCHSVRSYRSALSDCGSAHVGLTSERTVAATVRVWHRAPALDRLPARAPPLS